MSEYVMVTDREPIGLDDYYLSDEWLKNECPSNMTPEQIREMARNKKLLEAYIVSASNYCIYKQMDAHQVLIDDDVYDVVVHCENVVIGNKHRDCWEYDM